jgi:hypothetical protein
MIELRKQALNGAFGVASKAGNIVLPIYESKDPLKILPMGKVQNWPDLVIVMEGSLSVLKVREKEAHLLLPFKRLDVREVHNMGLLFFKDMINNSKVSLIAPGEITWKDLASIIQKYGLSGYVHRHFLQSIKR